MSKLLGDSQSQSLSENSQGIQVGRDLNYSVNGLTYRDVKEVCTDLIEANFPKLREEAIAISMKHVEEFSRIFFNELVQKNISYVEERLKDPDVQAAINTSIVHVARMTNKSHKEILSELLSQKITNIEDEKNIIYNDAIDLLTKLTKNQILFIVFIYSIRVMTIVDPHTETEINDCSIYYNYYENEIPDIIGFDIYPVDKFIISYRGLTNSDGLKYYSTSLNSLLESKTGIKISNYDINSDLNDSNELVKNFPKLTLLIKKFGFNSIEALDKVIITSLAYIIAKAYLINLGYLK